MSELRFSESHEWHLLDGDVATIGVSAFAVDELSDITYLELPEVGRTVSAGEAIGEIESVKSTGELYVGVSGTISEVNTAVIDNPGIVNDGPEDASKAWLIKITMSDASEAGALLSESAYREKYPVG